MIITQKGIIIRMGVTKLRVMGRATQGVRLIQLDQGDKVNDVARVVTSESPVENGNGAPNGNGANGGNGSDASDEAAMN